MASMNKCLFIGVVCQKNELKSLDNNKVLNFTLAVNESYKDKSGGIVKKTVFPKFESWDSGAESFDKSVQVGDLVMVEARLKQSKYEQNGAQVYVTTFRADRYNLIKKKRVETPTV